MLVCVLQISHKVPFSFTTLTKSLHVSGEKGLSKPASGTIAEILQIQRLSRKILGVTSGYITHEFAVALLRYEGGLVEDVPVVLIDSRVT